jgi:peptidyl-dipeptidase A
MIAHGSIAMTVAVAEEPGWLQKVAGVSEGELDGDAERFAARRRAAGLVFTRWALVMFHFERALYEDPEREDLNSLWWDLVERIQLVNRAPGRNAPDWAAKIHVAIVPVYYHNYVLGNLISAQLRDHLEARVTAGEPYFASEAAVRYLQEAVFGPGARNGWQDTVIGATGERLNPDYFVRSLL